MRRIGLMLVLISVLFVACSNKEVKETKMDLLKEWTLVSINDNPVKGQITLSFDKNEEKISGLSGINRYFGSVVVGDGNVEVGIIGSTFMAGEEEMMKQESIYLEVLSNVSAYEIIDNKLILTGIEKKLIFE